MCPGSKAGQQHPGLYEQEHSRRTREGMLWNTPSRFQSPSTGMTLESRSGFSKGPSGQAGAGARCLWERLGELGLSSPEKQRLMGT